MQYRGGSLRGWLLSGDPLNHLHLLAESFPHNSSYPFRSYRSRSPLSMIERYHAAASLPE